MVTRFCQDMWLHACLWNGSWRLSMLCCDNTRHTTCLTIYRLEEPPHKVCWGICPVGPCSFAAQGHTGYSTGMFALLVSTNTRLIDPLSTNTLVWNSRLMFNEQTLSIHSCFACHTPSATHRQLTPLAHTAGRTVDFCFNLHFFGFLLFLLPFTPGRRVHLMPPHQLM